MLPCFDSREQWIGWRELAAITKDVVAGPCTDCTKVYQRAMIRENRCQHPEVTFRRTGDGVSGFAPKQKRPPEVVERLIADVSKALLEKMTEPKTRRALTQELEGVFSEHRILDVLRMMQKSGAIVRVYVRSCVMYCPPSLAQGVGVLHKHSIAPFQGDNVQADHSAQA